MAVLGLPTAQFPNIADPQIQVKATYVGADALTVEQSVATPIEQQMSGVDNMDYMYSLNANNGTMNIDGGLRRQDRLRIPTRFWRKCGRTRRPRNCPPRSTITA